jgi:hypothetical protein
MPSVFVLMMTDWFHESFIRSTKGNVAYILNHTITLNASSVEIIDYLTATLICYVIDILVSHDALWNKIWKYDNIFDMLAPSIGQGNVAYRNQATFANSF